MGSHKRLTPSLTQLEWRSGYLSALRFVTPPTPKQPEPLGLFPGNTKTGLTGSLFKTIFVWNLPAVASCPGASQWCLTRCYNADPREAIFPVHIWTESWAWFVHRREELFAKILSQLRTATPPVGVRIHSSGDFYSPEYIDFWIRLATATPNIAYWAYTRSWVLPKLLAPLEVLRKLDNVQLFASCDNTMDEPPAGWRRSVVIENDILPQSFRRGIDLVCPEQTDDAPNCASCGYCIKERQGDVIFFIH